MEFFLSLFAFAPGSLTEETLYLFLSISVIYLRISLVKTAFITYITSIDIIPKAREKVHYYFTIFSLFQLLRKKGSDSSEPDPFIL